MFTHKIQIDLHKQNLRQRIGAVQGDSNSRSVEITLFDVDVPWVVPDGAACIIRYRKADGKGGVYASLPDGSNAWMIDENKVTIILSPDVLNVSGLVLVSAAVLQGEKILGIFSFEVQVEGDPSLGLTESTDDFRYSDLSQINTALAALFEGIKTDESLSVSGKAADAAAVAASLMKKLDSAGGDVSGWLNFTGTTQGIMWKTADGTVFKIRPHTSGNLFQITRVDTDGKEHATFNITNEGEVWFGDKALPIGSGGTSATDVATARSNLSAVGYSDFPAIALGTEYKTVEKWQGKAVYTKLVTCGTIPASGQKTVAHGAAATHVIRCLASTDDGTSLPYYYYPTSIDVMATTAEVQIYAQNRTEGGDAYVQIWYTKD